MVGPDGFTTTTHSHDFRPGGVWRFVMHGPDGRDYQNRITFDGIVSPERIVYHHGGGDDVEPVQFTQTVTFQDSRQWSDPPDLARKVRIRRGTRARHQGIRRRQGSGADHGTASRLRRHDFTCKECVDAHVLRTARARHHEDRQSCRVESIDRFPHALASTA